MRVRSKVALAIVALGVVVAMVGLSDTHHGEPAAAAVDRTPASDASAVTPDPQTPSALFTRGVTGSNGMHTAGRAVRGAGEPQHGARAETPSNARQEVTHVSGGFTNAPMAIPTGLDPATGNFSGLCPEQWLGDLTGNSTCDIVTAHFDPMTGAFSGSITDTFVGTFMGDHSTGTLVLSEHAVGNVFVGNAIVDGDIVASSGDPTFRCSHGHITIPVQLTVAEALGGYYGTWVHGCAAKPAATPRTPQPVYDPDTTIAGGITNAPAAVPTSGDPSTFDFSGVAPESWFGSLTGASKADLVDAHVDPATGDIVGHIVDHFVGVSMDDHSHGSLTIDEAFTGNLFTGAGLIEGTITAGTGGFACATGHLTMPLFVNAAGSFGGYLGTWTHGCRK